MHAARSRSEKASSGRLQEVKTIGKSLNFQARKMVAVAYRRWSFTRDSKCESLTGKVLDRRSLMGGGRIWRFDCIKIKRTTRSKNDRYVYLPEHTSVSLVSFQGWKMMRQSCLQTFEDLVSDKNLKNVTFIVFLAIFFDTRILERNHCL